MYATWDAHTAHGSAPFLHVAFRTAMKGERIGRQGTATHDPADRFFEIHNRDYHLGRSLRPTRPISRLRLSARTSQSSALIIRTPNSPPAHLPGFAWKRTVTFAFPRVSSAGTG